MTPVAGTPEDGTKLSTRWQQLAPEKKFGLITLVSFGSALWVAGRTARVLTKRIPKITSQPTEAGQGLTSTLEAPRHVGTSNPTPQSGPNSALSLFQPGGHQQHSNPIKRPNDPLSSTGLLASTPQIFWDNRSMLYAKARQDGQCDEKKNLNFNPILDAAAALGIATVIVAGSAGLVLNILGQKWELENWEDWRMFIQGGHPGTHLIPEGWKDLASSWIPQSFRLASDSEPKLGHDTDPDQWEWKQTLDREWKQDMIRRDTERREWLEKRESAGRRIW